MTAFGLLPLLIAAAVCYSTVVRLESLRHDIPRECAIYYSAILWSLPFVVGCSITVCVTQPTLVSSFFLMHSWSD